MQLGFPTVWSSTLV